jgi:hypothetical protein
MASTSISDTLEMFALHALSYVKLSELCPARDGAKGEEFKSAELDLAQSPTHPPRYADRACGTGK